MNSNPKTVLVVDDDPKILRAVMLRLKAAGYRVLGACNGVEALALAGLKHPDLIVADIWMPVGAGFSLAHRLNESTPRIPVIFLTASKQTNLKDMARKVGAAAFLEKPYTPQVLLGAIASALGLPSPARLGAGVAELSPK